jgi:glycosyltransferase involved in cell wall biosynthesis
VYALKQVIEVDMGLDAYELIIVDDGSTDNSLAKLRELAQTNACLHYLAFDRNYGKDTALFVGLCMANGIYSAVMDADFQDPPAILATMYRRLLAEEAQCIIACRTSRQGENPLHSLIATTFYWLYNRFTRNHIANGERDFRMMTAEARNYLLGRLGAKSFFKGIFHNSNLKLSYLTYHNVNRTYGSSGWPLARLSRYYANGFWRYALTPKQHRSNEFTAELPPFHVVETSLNCSDAVQE